ncbi:MAG: amidohydrolase family protein [Reyranella sp.]|nr:amidohydrolase family protein [Reyranella sp.]
MLIHNVEVGGRPTRLRIAGGYIEAIDAGLMIRPGEPVVDGGGGALLPGLHDHHIHLFAFARSLESVDCAAPLDAGQLARRLGKAAAGSGSGWVRGVGYHDAVAGEIDRAFLDACAGDVPIRVQHRSGRLWIFNSAGLDRLLSGAGGPDPFERRDGRLTGRLYDGDEWLGSHTRGERPDLSQVSAILSRHGVTGVTDTGHANGLASYDALRAAHRDGELVQDLLIFGSQELDGLAGEAGVRVGARKFHLHDHALPDPDDFARAIDATHAAGRGVAVHCVTVADLVLTLSCLSDAGVDPRDRIEHGSVIPPDLIDWIARLGVTVVTQPHFITERGDSYIADIEAGEVGWLYRAGTLAAAGVPVAAGSDAPYGQANPWSSMQAAVERRTRSGALIGADERLSAEAALALYAGAPESPGGGCRRLAPGGEADLCLLDRPWAIARNGLGDVTVKLTLKAGRTVWTSEPSSARR